LKQSQELWNVKILNKLPILTVLSSLFSSFFYSVPLYILSALKIIKNSNASYESVLFATGASFERHVSCDVMEGSQAGILTTPSRNALSYISHPNSRKLKSL
jgi:hypothetical protein